MTISLRSVRSNPRCIARTQYECADPRSTNNFATRYKHGSKVRMRPRGANGNVVVRPATTNWRLWVSLWTCASDPIAVLGFIYSSLTRSRSDHSSSSNSRSFVYRGPQGPQVSKLPTVAIISKGFRFLAACAWDSN